MAEWLRKKHLRVLDALLDPTNQSLPVACAQGVLVLALGVGIVVASYVKRVRHGS